MLPMTQEDQVVSHLIQHPARQAPQSPQEGPSSTGGMETARRRWVIQPLSPKLEPTDLRSILASSREQSGQERRWAINNEQKQNGSLTLVFPQHSVTVTSQKSEHNHDVLVRTSQVQVSEGDKSRSWDASCPSSPSSASSTESQKGFYSFVDEESNPEAEKTAAWMASPERQAKLATLKEENGFKLQAYSEERKPEKLFQDSNDDSRYQIEDAEAVERDERNEMQERLEIIRSQAPRKKPTFTEQLGALESVDLSNSSQMLEGLSLCYSPSSAEKSHTGAEPSTTDTERISFNAARQQFLSMEQSTSNSFLQSSQQLPSSKSQEKPFQADGKLVTSRKGTCDNPPGGQPISPSFDLDLVQNKLFGSKRVTVYTSEEKTNMNQSCLPDNLNSESLYSPSEQCILHSDDSNKVLGQEETGSGPSSLGMTETPIEREIRVAQEREESLRRERGIKQTDTKEMVEIKTKPLFSLAGPFAVPLKAKEKNRVSFFIQREIQMESQREVDLQNQGKVPGLYDRGTPQELEDRKRVFEQQRDLVPVMPNKTSVPGKQADVMQAETGAEDITRTSQTAVLEEKEKSSMSAEEEVLPPCCPHRHPDEKALQLFNTGTILETISTKEGNPHTPQDLFSLTREDNIIATDGAGNRVATSWTPAVARTANTNAVNSGDVPSWQEANKGSTSARGNNSARFTPFPYTPLSTPTGSPSLSSRPILRQTGHHERFNLRPRKVHTPEAIRREIEQDLKREEELRMMRETSVLSTSQDVQDRVNQQELSTDDVENETPQPVLKSETPKVLVLKEETEEMKEQVTREETSKQASDLSFSLESDTVDHQQRAPTTSKGPEKVTDWSTPVPSPRLVPGFPSVSIVTAQPWSSPRLNSSTLTQFAALKPQTVRSETGVSRAQKGLTETLLDDFEERRVRMKIGENAYAGIQPSDDVNNEVLEATRVTRHKSTRALQWEAGVFANKGED
ncbi:mitotic interactor and substrate of PLK1 [Scleropages formosus]|uniref:A-kinase anchor protein 2 C-terminal domain-containing protein n=1 Tax=Scleropages formosus TaxID=113540 RepID=A0A8C9V7U0_SCLFO|nr:mitotic interactor and substrate of PLK1 [Scleropages formosus]